MFMFRVKPTTILVYEWYCQSESIHIAATTEHSCLGCSDRQTSIISTSLLGHRHEHYKHVFQPQEITSLIQVGKKKVILQVASTNKQFIVLYTPLIRHSFPLKQAADNQHLRFLPNERQKSNSKPCHSHAQPPEVAENVPSRQDIYEE
jgi:hypothetical protein